MFRSERLEYKDGRIFNSFMKGSIRVLGILVFLIMAFRVVPGFADVYVCPDLYIDNDFYLGSVAGGSETCHYYTPMINGNENVYTSRNDWTGNGSGNLEICTSGLHWIDNPSVLTISSCAEVATPTPTPITPTVTSTPITPTVTNTPTEPTPTPTETCRECEPSPTPTQSSTPPTECRLIPQYEQWKLWDSDQGENYIANCYIISVEPPSVEDQERLCTLCEDQLEVEGYRYQADRWRHGTVYLNECTGEYVFIFDGGTRDDEWSTHWFRSYMQDNIRTKPRCPSCEVRATAQAND